MSTIHPLSVVDPAAQLGANVTVGPFCTVGPHAVLGDGVELLSHAVVAGRTTIGARTKVFPFASIGHQPQDLKFHGEPSTLEIGADCLIRGDHESGHRGRRYGHQSRRPLHFSGQCPCRA